METRRLELTCPLDDDQECDRCHARLLTELGALKGVVGTVAHEDRGTLGITYDPNTVPAARLEAEARRIGAAITEAIDHRTVEMRNLDCPDCASAIEKAVKRIPGVLWAAANFAAAQLYVEYERERVGLPAICRAIEGHGVGACPLSLDGRPDTAAEPQSPLRRWWSDRQRPVTTGLAILLTLLAAALAPHGGSPLANGLYAAAVAVGGYGTARSAWMALRARAVDMNVLMAVAVIGAMGIGDWFEAATVVILYNIGNLLQAMTMERTRRSIRSLMTLSPQVARVVRAEREDATPVEDVAVGDVVRLRPGERVPMDGVVIDGRSAIDQAPITGESAPVEKAEGDTVYAGTLNGQGSLDVRVTRPFKETMLARIVQSVEEAQAQRAPSQQFVDRFARVYTPIVVGLAALLAIAPPLALTAWAGTHGHAAPHGLWRAWLLQSLSLLIIACPCALVISTPVAVVTAIGNASRFGALVKGGLYLEQLARLRAMLYDKTGTLTRGSFRVEDVAALDGMSREEVLRVAAAMEARSEHPLAPAFAAAAGSDPAGAEVEAFHVTPGQGVRATVDRRELLLGNARLLRAHGVELDGAKGQVERLEAEGKTVVVLASRERALGIVALSDTARDGAREAVAALRGLGIGHQAMLTGDNERVARGVAERVGLDGVHAGLLPDDKLRLVKESRAAHGTVGMVGDGINDAPALAAADVGIVMGAAGSDTAMETADVALMSDDLTRLPRLVRLSRRTVGIIRQNVAFSLATKAGLVLAAVFVGIPLWLAVLGDVGVSLLVTLNALRLAR